MKREVSKMAIDAWMHGCLYKHDYLRKTVINRGVATAENSLWQQRNLETKGAFTQAHAV